MSTQEVAELQVVLEGVSLPASKQELVEYARAEDGGRFVPLLSQLPEREFESLDEVGEELATVQPDWPQPDPHQPREESGSPPGGEAYTDPTPEPGAVREHTP